MVGMLVLQEERGHHQCRRHSGTAGVRVSRTVALNADEDHPPAMRILLAGVNCVGQTTTGTQGGLGPGVGSAQQPR